MIFNSYAQQKESLAGMHLVSCGHIFAKEGREIRREKGREDWLLFYVGKGEETFYFDRAVVAPAGSFVLFAPGEKQHHAYHGTGTGEFYYVHFRCERLPDGLELKTSQVYFLPPQSATAAVFETIIEATLEKPPHYEPLCLARLLTLLATVQKEAAHAEAHAAGEHRRIARAIHRKIFGAKSLTGGLCCDVLHEQISFPAHLQAGNGGNSFGIPHAHPH